MADTLPGSAQDASTPEEKKARQIAGLKPIQKGQVLNPEGKNGRRRAEYVAAWLEDKDPEDPEGKARIDIVLQREYDHTKKHKEACKALREAYAGRPKQSVDLSSEDGSMSPMGPDSIGDSLRAAIEERRKAAQQAKPEAPVTDEAGAK